MKSISITADSALGVGASTVYTLRTGTNITSTGSLTATSDLSDQALSCTINSGAHSCSGTGSVTVNANDLFDVKVVVTSTTPTVHNVIVALVCQ
jgi:hypothetical protein